MAHPHADATIRTMPTLVLKAIRAKAFLVRDDADLEKIRHASRLVVRAAAAGHDVMPLMTTYASMVDGAMPRCDDQKPWTPEMHEIHELTWPFVASPLSLSCTFWAENGKPSDLDALIAAISAWTEARDIETSTTPDEADRQIREEMDRVCAMFPRLGMSYGYIGNIWSGPHLDDRSFMIFTQVQHLDDVRGGAMNFGGHSYEGLSRMRTQVVARLEDWARDLNGRLDAGTARLRSTRHLQTKAA